MLLAFSIFNQISECYYELECSKKRLESSILLAYNLAEWYIWVRKQMCKFWHQSFSILVSVNCPRHQKSCIKLFGIKLSCFMSYRKKLLQMCG